MTIKDILEKLYNQSTINYYVNDVIKDLDEIIDCECKLDGFELENNTLCLYSSEYNHKNTK